MFAADDCCGELRLHKLELNDSMDRGIRIIGYVFTHTVHTGIIH
jgi:hypothetical protein